MSAGLYSELPPHLDQRFEDIERQLFAANDIAQVMHRRAAFLHVVGMDVVLAEEIVCFVLGHGSLVNWPGLVPIPLLDAAPGGRGRPPLPSMAQPLQNLLVHAAERA